MNQSSYLCQKNPVFHSCPFCKKLSRELNFIGIEVVSLLRFPLCLKVEFGSSLNLAEVILEDWGRGGKGTRGDG